MPNFRNVWVHGRVAVILTVTNVRASVKWYAELLDLECHYEDIASDGRMRGAGLIETASDFTICFVSHANDGADEFAETNPGLDHLEFLVESRADLDEWIRRLDELKIVHSGVKEPNYSKSAMITFRDPDNIQLEFYWRPKVG